MVLGRLRFRLGQREPPPPPSLRAASSAKWQPTRVGAQGFFIRLFTFLQFVCALVIVPTASLALYGACKGENVECFPPCANTNVFRLMSRAVLILAVVGVFSVLVTMGNVGHSMCVRKAVQELRNVNRDREVCGLELLDESVLEEIAGPPPAPPPPCSCPLLKPELGAFGVSVGFDVREYPTCPPTGYEATPGHPFEGCLDGADDIPVDCLKELTNETAHIALCPNQFNESATDEERDACNTCVPQCLSCGNKICIYETPLEPCQPVVMGLNLSTFGVTATPQEIMADSDLVNDYLLVPGETLLDVFYKEDGEEGDVDEDASSPVVNASDICGTIRFTTEETITRHETECEVLVEVGDLFINLLLTIFYWCVCHHPTPWSARVLRSDIG